MSNAQRALTRQMLEWIAAGNHSYGEAINVWKTSCPRLSVWEDACIDGLVDCTSGHSGTLFLTEKGRKFLGEESLAATEP
jgi:hypothetical protein